jgi:5-methyltetrahydropteroyltriglutamate--homocysteine methyltransferase
MPVKVARKPLRKSTARRSSSADSGRILTTHVGSLVRPPALREFLAAERDGRPYDETAFRACLHDSVAEVVRKQADIGLDIINDGEYGKTISWSRYVLRRLSGFEQRGHGEAGMPAAVRPP